MTETLKVVRMHLVNKQTFVWLPAIVLALGLVISLVANGAIHLVQPGGPWPPGWPLPSPT